MTRQSTSASALEDGATGYGPNSVVYGVPSYPAVGRVIGFYNQNTMVFELDDMYTRASPSEIHQLIMSGGAADAEAENFVAVGVPLTYSASAATGAGADAADSTAPSAPADSGTAVLPVAPSPASLAPLNRTTVTEPSMERSMEISSD